MAMDNNQSQMNFLQTFITNANEHSKKLTVIDTAIYCILMMAALTLTVLFPHLADNLQAIVGYITTAFVALRGLYSGKAALENYSRIKNAMTNATYESPTDYEEISDSDDESLG